MKHCHMTKHELYEAHWYYEPQDFVLADALAIYKNKFIDYYYRIYATTLF